MSDLDKLLEEAKATAANVQFDTRICSKCEIEKSYSDFSFASQTKAGELICSSCNTLLGAAGDSLDVLYEAIAYVKRHRGL